MNEKDDKSFLISDVPTGKLNALVKCLMKRMKISNHHEVIRRITSGRWIVKEEVRWKINSNGTWSGTVTSQGATGSDWISDLRRNDFSISGEALAAFTPQEFFVTDGFERNIVIIPATSIVDQSTFCTVRHVASKAVECELTWPYSPEVACLVRRSMSDSLMCGMGFEKIVCMSSFTHDGHSKFLVLAPGRLIETCLADDPDGRFGSGVGFAFVTDSISRQVDTPSKP
jgi:hypothetical protein